MTLHDLSTGWNGLFLAWGLVAAPIAVMSVRQGGFGALPFVAIQSVVALAITGAVAAFVVQPLLAWALGPQKTTWWMLVVLPLGGYLFWLYANRNRSMPDAFKRGAIVVDGLDVSKSTARVKRQYGDAILTIAGAAVPPDDEAKHFKLMGTTGSGKSTAIRELMHQAIRRGDRAVIADPDGGYLSDFYDAGRGDVILNPFDQRSVKWDLFSEIDARYDVDQLARSLIVGDDEWNGYARTFFAAVTWRCHELGMRDTEVLWRLLAVAPNEELRPIVEGTAAQPFLEVDNARMFGSIRAVAVSAIASLEYIRAQDAQAFSVREWVRSGRGVLFLPYQPEQIAALRSVIATWMRLAIFQTMGLGESADRRIWFVVDELDALGRIDGLKDALARVRKYGGRCVLGFQSIAQVSSTYGEGDARTIVENCSNTLILRCSASEGGGTAEFASRLIGEREIVREQVSVSVSEASLASKDGAHRSVSRSEQHLVETAVMASEIEGLPDRVGYLKFASHPAWIRVSFPLYAVSRWPQNSRSIQC